MAKSSSINLLRSSQTHYVETFLKWALSTGRFLIILTETIALAAFVYRFSLDREIIDLADKIKNNRTVVSLYRDEPLYRNIQERLEFSNTLTSPSQDRTKMLRDLVNLAQGKVAYRKISITQNDIGLELTTNSTNALSAFTSGLKQMPLVKSITVTNVENKANTGTIVVNITAKLIGANTQGSEVIPHASN